MFQFVLEIWALGRNGNSLICAHGFTPRREKQVVSKISIDGHSTDDQFTFSITHVSFLILNLVRTVCIEFGQLLQIYRSS